MKAAVWPRTYLTRHLEVNSSEFYYSSRINICNISEAFAPTLHRTGSMSGIWEWIAPP